MLLSGAPSHDLEGAIHRNDRVSYLVALGNMNKGRGLLSVKNLRSSWCGTLYNNAFSYANVDYSSSLISPLLMSG